jgi:hypothetical protein
MSYHSTPATHSSYCNGNVICETAQLLLLLQQQNIFQAFFQPKIVLSLYIKFTEAIGNLILTEVEECFVPNAISYLKGKSKVIPVTGHGGL